MPYRILLLTLCLSFFWVSLLGQVAPVEAKLSSGLSEHPVRAHFMSSIGAFNDGKLESFLANFSSDIKMYGTDGIYQGKEALRTRFKAVFDQFPAKRMEIPELSLEVLSEKTVLVHFKWKLYPMGQGPAYTGVGSGIYVLEDGKWTEVLEVETVTHVDEALRE